MAENYMRSDYNIPLFFLHIPKTSGSTMRDYLKLQYQFDDICPAATWKDLAELELTKIREFKLVAGHFGFNALRLCNPGARSLVVLRNPIDRALSSIKHLKRDPHYHPLHKDLRHLTISDIINDKRYEMHNNNVMTRMLSADVNPFDCLTFASKQYRDGLNWLPEQLEAEVCDINKAKENLEDCDFIVFTERLSELTDMAEKMRYHPPRRIAHANAAPGSVSDHRMLSLSDLHELQRQNAYDIELYTFAEVLAANRAKTRVSMHQAFSVNVKKCRSLQTAPYIGNYSINLAGPLPGCGWYEVEFDQNGGPYRWTGPDREFSLEIVATTNMNMTLELNYLSISDDFHDNFTISVNNKSHNFSFIQKSGSNYIVLDIENCSSNNPDGVYEILFNLPSISTPTAILDVRPLGIAIFSISMQHYQPNNEVFQDT